MWLRTRSCSFVQVFQDTNQFDTRPSSPTCTIGDGTGFIVDCSKELSPDSVVNLREDNQFENNSKCMAVLTNSSFIASLASPSRFHSPLPHSGLHSSLVSRVLLKIQMTFLVLQCSDQYVVGLSTKSNGLPSRCCRKFLFPPLKSET